MQRTTAKTAWLVLGMGALALGVLSAEASDAESSAGARERAAASPSERGAAPTDAPDAPAGGPPDVAATNTPGLDLAAADRLLTTTRTVRKRLDLTRAVESAIIAEAIEVALQAPTGGNRQAWRFLVITDPAKRKVVADVYRRSFERYAGGTRPAGPPTTAGERIRDSAWHLADHMHEVPVLVIACIEGRAADPSPAAQAGLYGSVLPSAWSLMLALRARGLGSAWTTLHLAHEREVATALGIPETVTQAVLLPVAYYTGTDFKPAPRRPAREVTYWNAWGETR